MAKERVFVSPEARANAIGEIQSGRPRKEVAEELGVSLATVHLWMAKVNTKPPATPHTELPGTHAEGDGDGEYGVEYLKMRVRQLELDVKHLKERLEIDTKHLKEKIAIYEGKDAV